MRPFCRFLLLRGLRGCSICCCAVIRHRQGNTQCGVILSALSIQHVITEVIMTIILRRAFTALCLSLTGCGISTFAGRLGCRRCLFGGVLCRLLLLLRGCLLRGLGVLGFNGGRRGLLGFRLRANAKASTFIKETLLKLKASGNIIPCAMPR